MLVQWVREVMMLVQGVREVMRITLSWDELRSSLSIARSPSMSCFTWSALGGWGLGFGV